MTTTQEPFQDVIAMAITYLSDIDPIMRAAIERVGPCTLVPSSNVFEALIDAIISQQISVKAADAIVGRLRATLPDGLITPAVLAPLDVDTLRGCGLSTPKAKYVRNLLEHIESGQLDLARLPEFDDEAVIDQLVAVKGIGRWTAEMILIFSFGRADVLPVDDLGFLEGCVRRMRYLNGQQKKRWCSVVNYGVPIGLLPRGICGVCVVSPSVTTVSVHELYHYRADSDVAIYG